MLDEQVHTAVCDAPRSDRVDVQGRRRVAPGPPEIEPREREGAKRTGGNGSWRRGDTPEVVVTAEEIVEVAIPGIAEGDFGMCLGSRRSLLAVRCARHACPSKGRPGRTVLM